ncbi:uncharacterized protein LOC110451006 [Mizuhopecten yessoensis]|uniref:Uncharacterized protein n=1 Tax=Mizuhopecten yessoensis TaxID=6573 RepID=A0A210QMP0_MIZYE|nr:uncharacterized protein LOC110451006 [Mizuhopecten yessoensis]OWF49992.1 hypothetical protein KP79_PYT21836 [Mizuhopecten yessoensis]
MAVFYWIVSVILVLCYTGTEGLECYKCSHMIITSNLTYPDDEVIRQLAPGLTNTKCRRSDSNYVQTQNQQDVNNNANWNTGSQSGILFPNTCNVARPGSSKVVKCGVWEGDVYATVFNTKALVLASFAFGCAEVDDYMTEGCYSQTGEEADKVFFRTVLQGSFRDNVNVNNFRGRFCLTKDAASQLVSGGNTVKVTSIFSLLVASILTFFLTKMF